jgi:hypothetical protein
VERPVVAPLGEQVLAEGDVAILGARALLDPDGHAVEIEVGDLEGDDFAGAQAGGVGGGEDEAVRGERAGVEEPPDLGAAEDLGEALGLAGCRDDEGALVAAEDDVREEAEGVGSHRAGAPRQPAALDEMGEIGLDLVVGEIGGGASVVPGEPDTAVR